MRVLGVVGVVLAMWAIQIAAGDRAVMMTAASQAGMRAYVDPQTGRRVFDPVVPEPRAVPAPLPPLAEVPAPGGGMMVHLDGRFMSSLVATVDEHGDVHVGCVTEHGSTVHSHR